MLSFMAQMGVSSISNCSIPVIYEAIMYNYNVLINELEI